MGKYDFNLKSILNELEKKEDKGAKNFSSDFWKPTIEKGQDTIDYRLRFLPNPDSENGFCWVERFAHMFTFPNKKYTYQACPKRNNGDKCYYCEEKDKLYATGDSEKETLGQKRCAKLRYFYNVLILEDPRDGGKNVGKVLIYEAGIQVHEKLTKFLYNKKIPESERIFYHPTQGCDFTLTLKMKKTTGGDFQNYDDSEFDRSISPITLDGKELSYEEATEFIDTKCFKLNERILSPKAYKDYETLKETYVNQGMVEPKNDKKKSKEAEEIGTTLDETIKNEKVETRNPTKKVEVEKEVEDDDLPETGDDDDVETDEDAELDALLADD